MSYDNEPVYMSVETAWAAHTELLRDLREALNRLQCLRPHFQRSARYLPEDAEELWLLDGRLGRAEGSLLGTIRALQGL